MEAEKVVRIPRIDERKYEGKWVAVDMESGQVLAANQNLDIVADEAKAKGHPNPAFFPVSGGRFHCHVVG